MASLVTVTLTVGDCGERLVIKCSMNWTVLTHMRHGIPGDSSTDIGDHGERLVIKCSKNQFQLT